MLLFRRLKVKDVDPYKSASFDFTPGLHVIYGLNKTTEASTNGNASGKSRFFSMVPETIFDSPVLGTTQDRVQEGERELEVDVNGDSFTFHRKGGKLSVKNAEGNLVGRTTKETKLWLAKNFPLTEDDSASYLYLDSLRPHPLVRGTTTERKRFLDSFFDLEKIGFERKKITAQLARLQPVKAAHAELQKERDAIAAVLAEKPSIGLLKTRVEKARTRLEHMQADNARNMEIRRVVEYVSDNQKPIRELVAALQEQPLTEPLFRSLYADAKRTLTENLGNLKHARDYAAYQALHKNYGEALKKLTGTARKVLASEKMEVAERHHRLFLENQTEADRVKAGMPEKLEKPVPPEESPKGQEEDLLLLQSMLKTKLEHAREFGTGTCPTCGQHVDIADPVEIERKLKRVRRDLAAHAAYTEYMKALGHYQTVRTQRLTGRTRHRELRLLLDKYRLGHSVHLELRNLPDAPPKYKGPRLELPVFERMVEEDQYRVRCLEILEPGIELLCDYYALKTTEYDKTSTEMTELAEKYATLTADLEVVRTYRRRIKSMDTDLQTMVADLESERLIKMLLAAYSDKAMKKMAVQAISNSLMSQINKYAARIFPENYRFELVWERSQIAILCHRRYGKRLRTSDVRKLSGAESRLFTYVTVLSLLTFVPDYKRSSVLILDEPATNMSAETHESFKELLSIMNQVIPTIVIITPNSDEVYDNAKSYTAIKRGGVSTLVPGHPRNQ